MIPFSRDFVGGSRTFHVHRHDDDTFTVDVHNYGGTGEGLFGCSYNVARETAQALHDALGAALAGETDAPDPEDTTSPQPYESISETEKTDPLRVYVSRKETP